MKFELETIPVWESYTEQSGCPICYLAESLEKRYVDFFLGGAVMAPEVRVEVNKKGFCPRHWVLLYNGKNKLGLSLMVRTHRDESEAAIEKVLSKLSGKAGEKQVDAACARIQELSKTCLVCDKIEHTLDNYRFTIAKLHQTNEEFRAAFAASSGICRPHLPGVVRVAASVLRGDAATTFFVTLKNVLARRARAEAADLDAWIESFDYKAKEPLTDEQRQAPARNIKRLAGAARFQELGA